MKPPHRVHPLQEQELKQLQQAIKTHPDPRVRWRAVMIRLSHEGRTAPEIAELLGWSRQKVLTWIERYEQEGLGGLEDRPRSGVHVPKRTPITLPSSKRPWRAIHGPWGIVSVSGQWSDYKSI